MSDLKSTSRIKYIGFLRVLSALAVVFLHVNNCFWMFSDELYWKQANVIESVFYFAVPVFFMICGPTNLNYRDKYSTKEYLMKRFNKTVIPFLAWSVIAIVYRVLSHDIDVANISAGLILKGVVESSFIKIYWFFWALFGIYLMIPLFSLVPKDKRVNIYSYIILIIFIFDILPSFILNITDFSVELPVTFGPEIKYIAYVLLGYVLNEIDLKIVNRLLIYCVSLIGLIAHALGTYLLSIMSGEIVGVYKGYDNIPCFFYSIGVFVFVKYFAKRISSDSFWHFIDYVGGYTFSVYLIHIYIWYIMLRLGVDGRSLLIRIIMPFLIMGMSMTIVWVVRKIPIVRRIVP